LKKVIKQMIDVVNNLHSRLQTAYDETWGVEDLTQEFSTEVEDRKEYNKFKTIDKLAKDVAESVYKKHHITLNEIQAKKVALALFEKAKRDGAIDELNNIVEEK